MRGKEQRIHNYAGQRMKSKLPRNFMDPLFIAGIGMERSFFAPRSCVAMQRLTRKLMETYFQGPKYSPKFTIFFYFFYM